MVEERILTPVNEPTNWVSSMVTVVKPDKLRICIDPKDLNRAIKRDPTTQCLQLKRWLLS